MIARSILKMSAPKTISKVSRVFQRFFQLESAGGIILIICATLAMLWANSPWHHTYHRLWETQLFTGRSGFNLHTVVNDGLMALFFLVVGLEIKRELMVGELSDIRQAMLPLLAALGGMLLPALLYMAFNPVTTTGAIGWGIPTVTDIAFSLGVLALLGNRVPMGLKVFLVALAIADDVGAVLLIALFYSTHIDWLALGLAGVTTIASYALIYYLNQRLGCHGLLPGVYLITGLLLWFFFHASGVHATLAGVVLALLIPLNSSYKGQRQTLSDSQPNTSPGDDEMFPGVLMVGERLHPWSTYLILPLFALANAGVNLSGFNKALLWQEPVSLGIIIGLVLGKQLGVTVFSLVAAWLNFGKLPDGVGWWQLYAVSWLAGIGFTMSIFMANLAFPDATISVVAKLAIFVASLLSALVGLFLVWLTNRQPLEQEPSAENSILL